VLQIPATPRIFLVSFSHAKNLISHVISFLSYKFLAVERHTRYRYHKSFCESRHRFLNYDKARNSYSTKGNLQVKPWQVSSQLLTDVWSWAPRRTGSRDLHGWVSKSTSKKPLSGNRAPCLDRAFKSPRLTVSGAFVRLSEMGRGFIVCVVSVKCNMLKENGCQEQQQLPLIMLLLKLLLLLLLLLLRIRLQYCNNLIHFINVQF